MKVEFIHQLDMIMNTIPTVLQGRIKSKYKYYFILSYHHRSPSKDQLFSTKPRLARSGSKAIIEKSQISPTTNLTSGYYQDHYPSSEKTNRANNSYVEVVGRGYIDDKNSNRRLSNDSNDDRQQQITNKSRAKIIKGNQMMCQK